MNNDVYEPTNHYIYTARKYEKKKYENIIQDFFYSRFLNLCKSFPITSDPLTLGN